MIFLVILGLVWLPLIVLACILLVGVIKITPDVRPIHTIVELCKEILSKDFGKL